MNYDEDKDQFSRQIGRLKRLWKPALLTSLLVLAVGTLIVMLVPSRYQSTAVILIEQQQIPQDLVRTTVTGFAEERIQVLAQRVMTSSNLMSIIKRHNLYAKERRLEPRELILERMRKDIDLDFISAEVVDPRSNRLMSTTIAFTLAYKSKDPTLAFRISNELTSLILSENLKARTRMAEDTSRFLREESDRLEATVDELERKLATYRKDNFDQLPEFLDANYQMLGRTDREYQDVRTQLAALDEKLVLLNSRLIQAGQEALGNSTARGQLLTPAQQRFGLQAELSRALTTYSENHPDVRRLRRELASIDMEATSAAGSEFSDSEASTFQPMDSATINLQAMQESAQVEREALVTRLDQLSVERQDYQTRLASSPTVESEYRVLTRDYESALNKFREIRAKSLEANLAQSLEVERKSERFTLIDPPVRPENPVSPNRLQWFLLTLVLSIAAGLLFATIRASLHPRIFGLEDVRNLVPNVSVVPVPHIKTLGDRRRLHKRLAGAAAFTSLAAMAGAFYIHTAVTPLGTVWLAIMMRLGV